MDKNSPCCDFMCVLDSVVKEVLRPFSELKVADYKKETCIQILPN